MKKGIITGIAALSLLVGGCALNPFGLIKKNHGIEVSARVEQRSYYTDSVLVATGAQLNYDLDLLHEPLKNSIKDLILLLFSKDNTGAPGYVYHGDDCVYLDCRQYNLVHLVHEAVHTYSNNGISKDFFTKWNKLVDTSIFSDAIIDEKKWDKPHKGFLYPLGTTQCTHDFHAGELRYPEDVATWVMEMHANDFGRIREVDPRDSRNFEKIKLLREEDYISQKQFEKATSILGTKFKF